MTGLYNSIVCHHPTFNAMSDNPLTVAFTSVHLYLWKSPEGRGLWGFDPQGHAECACTIILSVSDLCILPPDTWILPHRLGVNRYFGWIGAN